MSNLRQLGKDKKESKKPKKLSRPKDIITDPMGQWKYPGQVTRIPGDSMATHGYGNIPLWTVPDVGEAKMVYPNTGTQYFPGASNFIEYPQMQDGGWLNSLPKAQVGKWLDKIQRGTESWLGHPMRKAQVRASDIDEDHNEAGVDNQRHALAAMYTKKAIENKFPNLMKYTGIPQVAGFVGANAMGIGHELAEPNRSMPWQGALKEGAEDVYNNFVGTLPGMTEDKIVELSRKGQLFKGTTPQPAVSEPKMIKNPDGSLTQEKFGGAWLDTYQDAGQVGIAPRGSTATESIGSDGQVDYGWTLDTPAKPEAKLKRGETRYVSDPNDAGLISYRDSVQAYQIPFKMQQIAHRTERAFERELPNLVNKDYSDFTQADKDKWWPISKRLQEERDTEMNNLGEIWDYKGLKPIARKSVDIRDTPIYKKPTHPVKYADPEIVAKQKLIGVTPDGDWGKKSQAAWDKYQKTIETPGTISVQEGPPPVTTLPKQTPAEGFYRKGNTYWKFENNHWYPTTDSAATGQYVTELEHGGQPPVIDRLGRKHAGNSGYIPKAQGGWNYTGAETAADSSAYRTYAMRPSTRPDAAEDRWFEIDKAIRDKSIELLSPHIRKQLMLEYNALSEGRTRKLKEQKDGGAWLDQYQEAGQVTHTFPYRNRQAEPAPVPAPVKQVIQRPEAVVHSFPYRPQAAAPIAQAPAPLPVYTQPAGLEQAPAPLPVYTQPAGSEHSPLQGVPGYEHQWNVGTSSPTAISQQSPIKAPEESSILGEAMSTLSNEGVDAFVEQLTNYVGNKYAEKTGGKEDVTVTARPEPPKEEIAKDTLPTIEPTVIEEPEEPKIPVIEVLGDTIDKGNRVFVPVAIDTKQAKFNYRNRGDKRDIKDTKGAYVSTYAPFREPSAFSGIKEKGISGTNNDDSTVIILNTKTGQISGGKFKDVKDNKDLVVSKTLPAKDVYSIEINPNAKYISGIAQKGLTLVRGTGKKQELPIGLGRNADGKALTGWSGGKMFITKPDGSNGYFVYGTVEQLKNQLEKYKKLHNVDHVMWYDLDHKAFSQAYQTKNNVISGKESIARDNTNSSGGNFLYLTEDKSVEESFEEPAPERGVGSPQPVQQSVQQPVQRKKAKTTYKAGKHTVSSPQVKTWLDNQPQHIKDQINNLPPMVSKRYGGGWLDD